MIDCEGPSNPADRQGNRYVLTYACCLCHGVFYEPMAHLRKSEIRRAFSRCVFRSGTLPLMLRSDRGPELKNALLAEYTALVGMNHRFGTAFRPMEQGLIERNRQEFQKILGMLVVDVLRSYPSEWSELTPVHGGVHHLQHAWWAWAYAA